MSDEVLETYIREYIKAQPGPSVVFDWQGGEPALLGLGFFERALNFQEKHRGEKLVQNTLQTNGTVLDQEWCAFLAKQKFLVGLSLDGPAAVHDAYRVDFNGKPTAAKVLLALEMLQKYGVEVNVLATINRESSQRPLEVYRFFKERGVTFIQFIPIIEREPDAEAEKLGISLAAPPSRTSRKNSTGVTPWSVEPEQYGEFLSRIFEDWAKNDVGKIFVMNFEWTLAAWAGAGPGVCYLAPCCGRNLIIEHNGDVYSCDHYVYPAHRLGNILRDSLQKMAASKKQTRFGAAKETSLSRYCRECRFLFACRGGCPKHRFAKSPAGESGVNYLCPGLRKFYQSVDPSLQRMADLLRKGLPVQKAAV